jgi:regulator of sigma E protease
MSPADLPPFLLAVAFLIAVHEWGHFRMARACGVKVLRFSVGFGRVLWRRVGRDGTEFTLAMLPLGGYVRMLDERDGPVSPTERQHAFNQRPLRQRAAIVAAGPVVNWLVAILMFTLVAWMGADVPKAVLGTPVPATAAERAGIRSGDWVHAVSSDGQSWDEVRGLPELLDAVARAQALREDLYLNVTDGQGRGERRLHLDMTAPADASIGARALQSVGILPYAAPLVSSVKPEGPGAQAGLQPGDRVLAINGRAVEDAGQLRSLIRAAPIDDVAPQSLLLRIERHGQVLEVGATPRAVTENGQRFARLEIGIGAAPERVSVSYGLLDGVAKGAQDSWNLAVLTVRMIGRMLVGEASVKNLSGPLSIAEYAGQSARAGLAPFFDYLGKISLSLAVLNLLPLPMLDGGHLMYHLFEGLSGRPVSEWWQQQLQRVGALILMLMMALALSNDVARLAGWH